MPKNILLRKALVLYVTTNLISIKKKEQKQTRVLLFSLYLNVDIIYFITVSKSAFSQHKIWSSNDLLVTFKLNRKMFPNPHIGEAGFCVMND